MFMIDLFGLDEVFNLCFCVLLKVDGCFGNFF